MPLDGAYSWKEDGLSPEERIDHFFNLIDHAVENGIPLKDLYSRAHLKVFLCYVLNRSKPTSNFPKDAPMAKLTLTSTFASSIIIGDPGVLTVNLPPKETITLNVTDVQLRQLSAQLTQLKTSKWIEFSVSDDDGTSAPAPVEPVAPPPPAPPAPTPESVPDSVPEPGAPEVPVAPTPVQEEEVKVIEDVTVEPAAAKPGSFDKKNRR